MNLDGLDAVKGKAIQVALKSRKFKKNLPDRYTIAARPDTVQGTGIGERCPSLVDEDLQGDEELRYG